MKNKKIISLLLIFSMMLSLLPMKMFMADVSTPDVTIRIIPTEITRNGDPIDIGETDANGVPKVPPTVHIGDTITYSIFLFPTENLTKHLAAIELQLGDIPAGLSFASGELWNDIEELLNINNAHKIEGAKYIDVNDIDVNDPNVNPDSTQVDFAVFNTVNKKIVIYGANYEWQNEPVPIATFTCTVGNGAAVGDYNISFTKHILVGTIDDQATEPEPPEIPSVDDSASSSTVRVAAETQGLRGDVNGDGLVDERDYMKLLRYVKGLTTIKEDYIQNAYINNDNTIDERDYMKLLRYVKGLITEL